MEGSEGRPLQSCLCTQAQLESPVFRDWAQRMRLPFIMHRKLWECCFIAQALYERDMLRPGRRGLGFAVGREPMTGLFTSMGCEVVASDLDFDKAAAGGWTSTGQHSRRLADLDERGLCNPELFRRRASFRVVDMNHIPDDLGGFDFAWSSCSMEHLGTLEHGIRFLENMARCLRPGGVAVHTTEFNLSSNLFTLRSGRDVIYRRRDVEQITRRLRALGHELEPVDYTPGDGPADRHVDQRPYTNLPHLKLRLRRKLWSFVATSLGLIIHVGVDKAAVSPRRSAEVA